jgi:hypothetical protein
MASSFSFKTRSGAENKIRSTDAMDSHAFFHLFKKNRADFCDRSGVGRPCIGARPLRENGGQDQQAYKAVKPNG